MNDVITDPEIIEEAIKVLDEQGAEKLDDACESTFQNKLTSWLTNIRNNLPMIWVCPNIEELPRLTSIPAIICAAGPSLEKNIEHVKKYHGPIFCVDRAFKTLAEHDIKPTIVTSIDGGKNCIGFLDDWEKTKGIIGVFSATTDPEILSNWQGERFFFIPWIGDEKEIENCIQIFTDNLPQLHTGGNVGFFTWYLAAGMQCNPLILIGADLAFPENYQRTELDAGHSTLFVHPKYHCPTSSNFYLFARIWRNAIEEVYPLRTTINCSDGILFGGNIIKKSLGEIL